MIFKDAKIIDENVASETYRRQAVQIGDPQYIMSRGSLMELANCPHRWRAGFKSDDTRATEWGSLMDCLVLSPQRFMADFAVAPETYTSEKGEEKEWNWNAKVCKTWRDQHDGATVIKSDLKACAAKALSVLEAEKEIWPMLQKARKQVMGMATWQDRATGLEIPLKILLDFAPQSRPFLKSLGDFKTGASADPRKYARSIYDHNYDAQAALYLDVWTEATGEDRIDFVHIVQESVEPYEVAQYVISEEFTEVGRMKYQSALRLYAQCLKSNFWPGYATDVRLSNGYIIKPEPWMAQSAGERLFSQPAEQREERQEEMADITP